MSSWVFSGPFGQSANFVGHTLLAVIALPLTTSVRAQDESVEYAEVSVDRYIPDDSLLLEKQGELKGEALATYYLGLSRQNAGDIDGALNAYEDVLEVSAGQITIAKRAARLAGQFGDGARGRKILKASFEANPDSPDAYLEYSEFLSAYHENRKELTDTALDVMKQAARRFPDNPRVYNRLITMHLTRREPDQAQAVLDAALSRPNQDPYYWLRIARVAQAIHRSGEDARQRINAIYQKALRFGKGDSEVENAVADYYVETKQYEEARDLYKSIVEERPEELDVRQKLARVYSILGDDDMELETLLELEQINPHRPETQRFLAERFLETQEYDRAIEHYAKALRIAPGTTRDYEILGRMYLREQRFDEAIELVERALFHYPEALGFKELLGRAMTGAERFEDAIKVYADAESDIIKAGPKVSDQLLNTDFYFSYGAAAERAKNFDKAAELFRKSIELVPAENQDWAAAPYNYLGYMWLEQDMNIDEAGELIIRANELRPDSGAYVDSLGWFHFKKKDYKEALKTLLHAETLMQTQGGDDAVVLDHVAQAYFELGYKEEAIDYMKRAVALDDSAEYKERLEAYRTSPDKEKVPVEFLGKGGEAKEDTPPEPKEEKTEEPEGSETESTPGAI